MYEKSEENGADVEEKLLGEMAVITMQERNEEEKWMEFVVERNINKILKKTTTENFKGSWNDLQHLLSQKPLSKSLQTKCFEVELLLKLIMKNAIERMEFLSLAAFLIKNTSVYHSIEFKFYFQSICDAMCQKYIALPSSDTYLNKHGCNFLKVLGHLFTMPREIDSILFQIISPIFREYVKQWTCAEEVQIVDELQEYRLAVYATAATCLVFEITQNIRPCDSEIRSELENFTNLIHKSILNAKLPENIRKIYLGGITNIQTSCGGDGTEMLSFSGMSVSGTSKDVEPIIENSVAPSKPPMKKSSPKLEITAHFGSTGSFSTQNRTVASVTEGKQLNQPNNRQQQHQKRFQNDNTCANTNGSNGSFSTQNRTLAYATEGKQPSQPNNQQQQHQKRSQNDKSYTNTKGDVGNSSFPTQNRTVASVTEGKQLSQANNRQQQHQKWFQNDNTYTNTEGDVGNGSSSTQNRIVAYTTEGKQLSQQNNRQQQHQKRSQNDKTRTNTKGDVSAFANDNHLSTNILEEGSELAKRLMLKFKLNPREYNMELQDARFFIIKSNSEDDIYRSIKYSCWTSTKGGNQKLNAVFKEQQTKGNNFPIYLVYSVNGSGHFCGVAEMKSVVDLNVETGIWVQDKWKGRFQVRWVYVKDIPNNTFHHIRLENNGNMPVTRSRDTQEVHMEKAKQVLNIIHNYQSQSSIFDDFDHYEMRREEDERTRPCMNAS